MIVYAEPPRLLTRKEAASRFGVAEATFDKLVREGVAPQAVRLGDRSVRWHSTQIAQAVDRVAGILPGVSNDDPW